MAYDGEAGQWTAPFIMAGINTRVVHRSNALLGYRMDATFFMPSTSDLARSSCRSDGYRDDGRHHQLRPVSPSATSPVRCWLACCHREAKGQRRTAHARSLARDAARLQRKGRSGHGRAAAQRRRRSGYASTARMLAEVALLLAETHGGGQSGGVYASSSPGATLIARLPEPGCSSSSRIHKRGDPMEYGVLKARIIKGLSRRRRRQKARTIRSCWEELVNKQREPVPQVEVAGQRTVQRLARARSLSCSIFIDSNLLKQARAHQARAELWQRKLTALSALPEGSIPIPPSRKIATSRSTMCVSATSNETEMNTMPATSPGAWDDLQDYIDFYLRALSGRAMP